MKDTEGNERVGDWMQTYTGRQFWPLDPRASEVDIRDIAHGLAMNCRYGGQCVRFYSVAEHSVLLSFAVPLEHARHALLHDATEAYLGDMIRPLKYQPGMERFRAAEHILEPVIFERFGLEVTAESIRSVGEADTRILIDERNQVMSRPPARWGALDGLEPLGVFLSFDSPDDAEQAFLTRFSRLFPEHA